MQGTNLRQRSQMLTVAELSKAILIPRWEIHREIALGNIAFNQLGNGETVVHEFDAWRLTDLNRTKPRTRADWFDTYTFVDIRDFGPRLDATGANPVAAFASRNPATGLLLGESILKQSAIDFAAWHLRSGTKRYGFAPNSRGLESFYRVGPDLFRRFSEDAVKKLQTVTYSRHGRRVALSSCVRAGFPQLCKRVVQEVF